MSFYKQINGLPMGSSCSPQIASLFMWDLEKRVPYYFLKYILVWKRYIDDIFVIWNGPTSLLEEFKKFYNNLHKNIKINWNQNKSEINFLDLVVCFDKTSFYCKTYQKSMNNFLYIPASSFHPISCKIGMIKSEIIRYLRTNSREEDFIVM